ncbi:MAG: riboflavin biosynthesis protein RibF [Kiritimatiellia bacterium]|jgi:riboflavin kinase/FMN adenylyltransferase
MKRLDSPSALAELAPGIALAAGFFDGVHLGHQAILAETCARARAEGSQAWVLTFEPHPLAVLAPERRPPLLTRLDLRLERLAETGVDGCLLLPFTPALAALSAADFVRDVFGAWMDGSRRCTVVSGENWHFGHGGAGVLSTIAEASGGRIRTARVPMVARDGERVSSSAIRQAILAGDLPKAAAMLGRPYAVRERTAPGRGVGRKLGFATANLHPVAEVLPPVGVYAVAVSRRCHPEQGWMDGVANLGFRPTFADAGRGAPVLEVHILDFVAEGLRDETLDVRFLRRLRDEIAFESPEALARQIERDIEAARSRR